MTQHILIPTITLVKGAGKRGLELLDPMLKFTKTEAGNGNRYQ